MQAGIQNENQGTGGPPLTRKSLASAAASGWAGWANFGVQLTPLQSGGADYAHHITASPPGFENPAAALKRAITFQRSL